MTVNPAKEPQPFRPAWRATIGPLSESGFGLLPANLSKQRGLIEEFVVFIGGWTARVLPKRGEIVFDSRTVKTVGKSGMELLWFRRMEQEIGTRDSNSAAAECLWYGFGIEWPEGRCGFRLYRDGRVEEGFNA